MNIQKINFSQKKKNDKKKDQESQEKVENEDSESIGGKDEDEIEEFTPTPSKKRKSVGKKNAGKKKKTTDKENETNNTTPTKKKKATKKKTTKNDTESELSEAENSKLFEIIKRQDTSSFASVVREWIKRYKKSPKESMLELVNLIIRVKKKKKFKKKNFLHNIFFSVQIIQRQSTSSNWMQRMVKK